MKNAPELLTGQLKDCFEALDNYSGKKYGIVNILIYVFYGKQAFKRGVLYV